MMFLFIIIVIVIVYLLLDSKNSRFSSGNDSGQYRERNPEERALEVLNERYARGEIDDEEYRNKKRVLQDK